MKKTLIILTVFFSLLSVFPISDAANVNEAIMQANNGPPGLQGRGGAEFPGGLERQEKTPHGWYRGEKVGWYHHHHYHHHHHYYSPVYYPDRD